MIDILRRATFKFASLLYFYLVFGAAAVGAQTADFLMDSIAANTAVPGTGARGAQHNIAAGRSKQPAFLRDGRLTLYLRNYSASLRFPTTEREGWVQSSQIRFESGFTEGPFGFGADVAPFVAVKLNGGQGAGNLIHLEPDGSGQRDQVWGYIGTYALKMRYADTLIRIGKDIIYNPFLDPYDIRSLPPSFRGASFVNTSFDNLIISGGSFDAVNARGSTQLQSLSTSYGGVKFDRVTYVGGDWKFYPDVRFALHATQSKNIWNQYYVGSSWDFLAMPEVKFNVKTDNYYTVDQGQRAQGDIDNKLLSLALTAKYKASAFVVSYQRIVGDQFFDFIQETSGGYVPNSVGVDYNGPGERSLQVRYKLDGEQLGFPGLQLAFWHVKGWGVDATVEANRYSARNSLLHGTYWKGGQPISGGHSEYGSSLRYTVRDGFYKDLSLAYIFINHMVDPAYPNKKFTSNRLTLSYPLRIF